MGFFDSLKDKFIGEEIEEGEVGALEPLNGYEDDIDAPATGETMGLGGGAIELKVVKPERYGNVKQIADHLLNHRTVVLNLESTNKETAKRLLDFLSGVAYSIDGQLKRVATNTFVITPSNVDVSGEQMRTAAGEDTSNYTTTFGVAAEAVQADNNSDSLY
ncbi:MAG: cell division protein SepF [Clostridia bacterium]|nr:cell division protein SepF [Clostridia bacterium]